MVLISKYDKKMWEDYVSKFEKFVMLPQKNKSINLKTNEKNTEAGLKESRKLD